MGNIGFKKLNKVVVDPPVAYPVNVEKRGCHYCKCDISSSELLTCVRCNVNIHRYCYDSHWYCSYYLFFYLLLGLLFLFFLLFNSYLYTY